MPRKLSVPDRVPSHSATPARRCPAPRPPRLARTLAPASLLALLALLTLLGTIPARAQLTLLGVTNTTWRHLTDNSVPPASWASAGFDDRSWPTGRGLFGNETFYPLPINTPIAGPNAGGPLTAYYRARFSWSGNVAGVILTGTNYVDDGCVVYLNGLELFRFNMPDGPPSHTTLALTAPAEPNYFRFQCALSSLTNGNPNPLVPGENVVAVEVHQNATGSSDHVFGLSLYVPPDLPPSACFANATLTNRVVPECQPTTFTVALNPECSAVAPTFQWYRVNASSPAGAPIPGATNLSMTLPRVTIADDGAYFCRLSAGAQSADSAQAILTVAPDATPPTLVSAFLPAGEPREIHLQFNEPVSSAAALPALWSIAPATNPAATVTLASSRIVDGAKVVLVALDPLNPSTPYRFTTLAPIPDACAGQSIPAGLSGDLAVESWLVDFDEARPWRYLDTGIAPAPAWRMPGFDDSSWKSGYQIFDGGGADPGRTQVAGHPVGTRLVLTTPATGPTRPPPSILFRTHFTPPAGVTQFVAQVLHDDGFILYINGVEAARRGVESTDFDTYEILQTDAGAPDQVPFFVNPALFVPGDNLIAVHLKQTPWIPGDATLGLRLSAFGPPRPSSLISIRTAPQPITVTEGRPWQMSVQASSGGQPLRYQWFHDGSPVPGATNPVISGLGSPARAGLYAVEVSTADSAQPPLLSTPARLTVRPVAVPYDTVWRYQTNRQDHTLAGIPWFAAEFDDATWPAGPGLLGVETTSPTLQRLPAAIRTALPVPGPGFVTAYFRARLTTPQVPVGKVLHLCHIVDDGVALYIDGQPALFYNVTNPPALLGDSLSLAATPGDGDARACCVPIQLTPGDHLFAAEVHQAATTSTDVLFGLELRVGDPLPSLAIRTSGADIVLTWPGDPTLSLYQSSTPNAIFAPTLGDPTNSLTIIPFSQGTARFFQLRMNGR